MAKVSWIDRCFYGLILNEKDEKRLNERANRDNAGSKYLQRIIEAGLALGERVEDSDKTTEPDKQ